MKSWKLLLICSVFLYTPLGVSADVYSTSVSITSSFTKPIISLWNSVVNTYADALAPIFTLPVQTASVASSVPTTTTSPTTTTPVVVVPPSTPTPTFLQSLSTLIQRVTTLENKASVSSSLTLSNYITKEELTSALASVQPTTIYNYTGGSSSYSIPPPNMASIALVTSEIASLNTTLTTQIDVLSAVQASTTSSQWSTLASDISYTGGKVSIGTTTATFDLNVVDDAGSADLYLLGNSGISSTIYMANRTDGSNWGISYRSNHDLLFYNYNGSGFTNSLYLKESGNIGVNSSAPGSKFSVAGNTSIGASYAAVAAPTSGLIVEGNVGIGTTTPSAKLAITGSGTSSGKAFAIANSSNVEKLSVTDSGALSIAGNLSLPSATQINFTGNYNDPTTTAWTLGDVLTPTGAGINTARALTMNVFGASNQGFLIRNESNTPLFEVNGDGTKAYFAGNVGVGTASPGEKLQVSGAIKTSGSLASWLENSGSLSQESGSLAGTWLSSAGPDQSTRGTINFYIARSDGGSGLSAMTINNQGNVGIGTTTPSAKLDVVTNDIGTGSTVGLIVSNNTPAVIGSQNQYSPVLTVRGRQYGTFGVNGFFNGDSYIDTRIQTLGSIGSDGRPMTNTFIQGVALTESGTDAINYNLRLGGVVANGDTTIKVGSGGSFSDITIQGNNGSLGFLGGGESGRLPKAAITYVDNGTGWNRGDLYFLQNSAVGSNNTSLADVKMVLTNAGNLGIGTTTPSAQLTTTGTVQFANFGAGSLQTDANGNVTVSSDENLKDIQGTFASGLSSLDLLSPITYKWKASTGYDTNNSYTGFSAQNVQLAIPEAVTVDKNGFLTLSDRPILATLVNAVKEIGSITGEFKNRMVAWLGDAGNGIGDFYANTFYSKESETEKLCVKDANGKTCITRAQLDALLQNAGQPITTYVSSPSTDTTNTTTTDTSTSGTSTAEQTSTTDETTTDTANDTPSPTTEADTDTETTAPVDTPTPDIAPAPIDTPASEEPSTPPVESTPDTPTDSF